MKCVNYGALATAGINVEMKPRWHYPAKACSEISVSSYVNVAKAISEILFLMSVLASRNSG
jgi:hypothetical protein